MGMRLPPKCFKPGYKIPYPQQKIKVILPILRRLKFVLVCQYIALIFLDYKGFKRLKSKIKRFDKAHTQSSGGFVTETVDERALTLRSGETLVTNKVVRESINGKIIRKYVDREHGTFTEDVTSYGEHSKDYVAAREYYKHGDATNHHVTTKLEHEFKFKSPEKYGIFPGVECKGKEIYHDLKCGKIHRY